MILVRIGRLPSLAIQFLFIEKNHFIMASSVRQLLSRRARTLANLNLGYANDEEEFFPEEIAEDDVAAIQTDEDFDPIQEEGNREENEDSDEELPIESLEEISDDTVHNESEDDDDEEHLSSEGLRAPSGLLWESQDNHHPRGRQPTRNIFDASKVGFVPGLHPLSYAESFSVFFGDCIDTALLHTNREGRRIAAAKNITWKNITAIELEAFIGLHLIAGALKAGHRDTRELWDTKNGHPIFRAAMSFQRFQQIKHVFSPGI